MLSILKKAGKLCGDRKTPNYSALAELLGCHRSSLYSWKKVPERYKKKLDAVITGRGLLNL